MGHNHGNSNIETKNISLAFFLNVGFTIIEIIGGLLTNSVAILSDAAHDLGDSISLGMSWYLQKIAKKDSDHKFTYGYRRYSVLGAVINLVILAFGSLFILSLAIPRLYHPEEVDTHGMLYLAVLGIIVNVIAMMSLRRGSSINEKVVSLHFLDDVLGWVAVLIGSIVMMIWDVPIIDPILSIMIVTYMMYNIYKNFKSTLDVLLQRTPRNINSQDVQNLICSKIGVDECQDLHIWSLDGEYNIMTCNIIFKNDIDRHSIQETLDTLHVELLELKVHHSTMESKLQLNSIN